MERDPACPAHDSRCTLERCITDPLHPQHVAVPPAPAPPEFLSQFFVCEHLPKHLQEVSQPFCELASFILTLPRNPERTVALRKLLEAKDCAVRARVAR